MLWFTFAVFMVTWFCPEPTTYLLKKRCCRPFGSKRDRRKCKEKKIHYLHFFFPPGQNRDAAQVCRTFTGKTQLLAWVAFPLEGSSLLSATNVYTWHSGRRRDRQQARRFWQPWGAGLMAFLDLLSGLMQLIYLAISIKCMTHLRDAKKFKDSVFLSLKEKS